MAERTAILVLGMHRSGTSAVTKVLNMLGATLPRRLMPAAVANPVGHFEPMDIVNIHDEILRSAGTKWSDWSRFPEGWFDSPSRAVFVDAIVRAVRENYGEAELFVVKDPRMARLVPVWTEALARLEVRPVAVVPYRNPLEVAKSLNTRDRFTVGQSLLIWLRHCLDGEAETRGMPRCFVSYDSLVTEAQLTAFALTEALPVAWPRRTAQAFADISGFLDPKLHRQKVPQAGLQHPDVMEAVSETFALLERLARDEADAPARARLDALRAELDTTASLAFAAFDGLTGEQQRLDRSVLELGDRFERLAEDVARLTGELRSARDAAASADAARSADLEDLRTDVVAELARWHAEQARSRAEQAASGVELDAVGERLRRLAGRVALDAFDARRAQASRLRALRPPAGEAERDELRRFVLGSGLFDPDWYRARYGDDVAAADDALDHYVAVGFARNYDPGPTFDAVWYLETNPDIREAGVPPLVHYVRSGIVEGRRGRPDPVQPRAGGAEPDHEP